MIVRFSFYTQRDIPLYAKKCNELLKRRLVHAIHHDDNGYYVEAKGDQATITQLATIIGESLPLSCWITATDISAVDVFMGQATPLKVTANTLPYCEACKHSLTDDCAVCGYQAQPESDVDHMMAQLLQQGQLTFSTLLDNRASAATTWLMLDKHTLDDTQLMFATIEQLEQACVVSERDVQLLLSIEKPSLRLPLKAQFKSQHQLPFDSYMVSLPNSKLMYQLAMAGLTHSIAAVVVRNEKPALQLVKYGAEVLTLQGASLPAALITHTPEHKSLAAYGLKGQWHNGELTLSDAACLDCDPHFDGTRSAAYALENIRQRDRFAKKCAVLYLDSAQPSGLLFRTADSNDEYQWLFETASMQPCFTLATLLERVVSNDPSSKMLVESFTLANPSIVDYSATSQGCFRDALGFLAITLGLCDPQVTLSQAADCAITLVASNKFETFPRIQFELQTQDDALLIDWAKAFQSVLSYGVAMPENKLVVIAGFIDSFADYLCEWIEKLDQHFGFEKITLAGNEFDNPVFLELLRLRLSKNVNLVQLQDSDLTQMNLVFGAMFVAKNARFVR